VPIPITTGVIFMKRSKEAISPPGTWVQVFEEDWAQTLPYDVLDATKLIPEEVVPLRIIGRMTLNRNPDNFFAETEQVAYCPANIVPGIDFTADPCSRDGCFPISTRKNPGLARPISIRSPSMRPNAHFIIFSATA
jgi:hypothetical protein